MIEVAVLQRVLPHYRLPFFALLRETLEEKGISLKVVYGQELPGTVPRTVAPDVPWARHIENRYLSILGTEMVWQPATREISDADLVIVEHAGRLLINYLLMLRRKLGGPLLAYWGHGANLQASDRRSPGEGIKRALMRQVDAWFAYTDLSAEIVRRSAYPEDRLFVVQNAIENEEFRQALASISPVALREARERLGIRSDNVGLYCGGMTPEKRLEFLLESCEEIRRRIADFEVVFLGSGPDQARIERASQKHGWIHYPGPVFGADRALFFALSRILLMPGLVGLVLVDSFHAGIPLFTTDIPIHSPEIAYLDNGVNGVVTPPTTARYAEAVAGFLLDPALQERLQAGCRESARRYTLKNMVDNFAGGVEACLRLGRLR